MAAAGPAAQSAPANILEESSIHRRRWASLLDDGLSEDVKQALRELEALAAPRRSVFVRAEAVSKDAFEDEHPPAGHQMLQVIRQGLDPSLRLSLPVLDVDDLRDQHVIG
jgi:hypothetical protein